MSSRDALSRATLVGFLVGFVVLLALLWSVGVGDVLSVVAGVDPGVLVVVLLVVFLWMGVWSGSLYLTSRVFGVESSAWTSFLVYVHMMFLDNVVPFSSISADPFAAFAVQTSTGADYETGLATVVTVDFLNFLPAPAFGIVGVGYLFAVGSVDETIETVAVSLVGLLAALVLGGYLGWRYRYRLGSAGSRLLATGLRTVRTLVPRVSTPAEAEIDRAIDDLIAHLETMAADRRTVLSVIALATCGWGLLAATLWLSLYAVGDAIPIGLALFLVSLVTVVELLPVPGGVGGYESLFVGLLVALSGTPPAPATAGVLVHRFATYWLPVMLGGGVTPFVLRLGRADRGEQ
jgi:hypothetical protein